MCTSDKCCLLQMSVVELMDMGDGTRMKARGGGESMRKDFQILVNILKANYEEKLRVRGIGSAVNL